MLARKRGPLLQRVVELDKYAALWHIGQKAAAYLRPSVAGYRPEPFGTRLREFLGTVHCGGEILTWQSSSSK